MRRTGVAALAATLLLTGACRDGGDDATSTTRRATLAASTTTTSTSTSTTTTTTVAARPTPVLVSTLVPVDAQTAVTWLVDADAALHDPRREPAALAAAILRQQLAYRASAEGNGWDTAVRNGLPETLRSTFDANLTATRELLALTKPRPALPPWRIVAPAPAAELLGYYHEAEAATGVPWQYLAAIHLTETRMGRIRGVSTAGAQGPMQFLPSTWEQYGEGGDIESNRDSIHAAGRLLRRNGAPERIDDALFSYNHSDHYVTAVKAYAGVMARDEASYAGYHGWQVLYRLESGPVLLPEGWAGA
jgi:membrane-bound lytic murein transglycosylase B